jgi:hypothetical protein
MNWRLKRANKARFAKLHPEKLTLAFPEAYGTCQTALLLQVIDGKVVG